MLVSISVLVASYVRPVRSSDYLQQARDAAPWLLWGMGSSLSAVLLGACGTFKTRLPLVVTASILFLLWLMLAGSTI